VERSRSDFPALLRSSSLSVSQAGYNTLMEVLDARARAVVVPFSGAAETEQALRAGALAERGRVEVVTEEDLSPESLAAAVDRAMRRPAPEELNIALNGAQRSAALVSRWIAGLVW